MRENAAVQMPRSFTKSTWMIRKTQSLVYFSKEFVEQSLLCFASVGLYRWSFFILSLKQLEQKSGSYVPLSRNSFQLVDLETQPRRWWGTKQVFLLWSLNRAHAMKTGHPRSLQHWYWAVCLGNLFFPEKLTLQSRCGQEANIYTWLITAPSCCLLSLTYMKIKKKDARPAPIFKLLMQLGKLLPIPKLPFLWLQS